MKFLNFIRILIDKLNEVIGKGISWLTSVLVLVVCFDVFSRYILGKSHVGIQEFQWHVFGLLFLLGAAYSLKYDRHVRVDIVYSRLSTKQKAWINLMGTLLFLIPFSLAVIWASHDFVINSFQLRESSPNPGGLPARYILKAAIPAGFFLLFLQALSMLVQSLQTILNLNQNDIFL